MGRKSDLYFALEINEHRPGKKKQKQKKPTNNVSEADTLISDGPKHFSDLVAEWPSVKSDDLRFCAPFFAKFELKKLEC